MRDNDESKSFNYFPFGGGDDSSDPYEDYPFSNDDDNDFDDEPCWMFKSIASLIGIPKPFGMLFPYEKEKSFLEKRGYEVKELKCSTSADPSGVIKVAYKKGAKINKKDTDELEEHNVNKVFIGEVQDIVLKWLLKIGGDFDLNP